MSYLYSIIVLTYNNLTYTHLCLQSIRSTAVLNESEIIIVDNASSDQTPQYLKHIADQDPNIRLILNDSNRGFAAGNNQGAAIALGEYLVFLNNDTIVTPCWLEGLRAHFDLHPRTGMVGPVTNDIGNEAKVNAAYRFLDEIPVFASDRAEKYAGKSFPITMLAMYCLMIRRDLFESIGGLDERYNLGTFEDDDLAMKVRQAGYEIRCAEDVFIHHFHSVSFSQLGQKALETLFRDNKRAFEEKWGQSWEPHQYRAGNP